MHHPRDFLNMHLVQLFWITLRHISLGRLAFVLYCTLSLRNWSLVINISLFSLHFSCINFSDWCVLWLVVKYLSSGLLCTIKKWTLFWRIHHVTQELNICITLNIRKKRVWKDKSGLVSTSNFYGLPVIKQFKQRAKRELLRRKCISGEHRRLDVLVMEVKIFRNANWKREMFAQTNWNSSIFYSSLHDFHVTNIRNLKDQLKNLKKMFNQKCLRRTKPTSSQSLESYLKPFNDVWFTLELILTNGTQTKYQRSWCRSKTKCLMS